MAKAKTAYVCADCGAEHSKWQGQCIECNAWNTLSEFVVQPAVKSVGAARTTGYAGAAAGSPKVTPLTSVALQAEMRTLTGIGELDRVLGGGLVDGSVVLIGGDPGIGKSTLLLQMLGTLGMQMPSVYVTGEESLAQVAARAQRLDLPLAPLHALAETCIERIIEQALASRPRVLVIDSIQTIWTELLTAAPGSVSQVRESAAKLTRFAKETGTSVFLVGHVTKEGGIAGPRVLEHMVDAVLYFEGESGSRFRVLRAFKNRFGAVNELGVFAMTEKGLRGVANPSALFLSQHEQSVPGSCVLVTQEGSRPLLVEVQALVDTAHVPNPRRLAVGLEQNRLAMLLAVLHRHAGIACFDQDVFLNAVGGVKITEPAADLALLLAIHSSMRNKALPKGLIVFGEVGLAGEIRPSPRGQERLKEAAKLGFSCALIPRANAPRQPIDGLQVIAVERIEEAIDRVRELD
ncbi:MAG TPA: DNA repair protein RadA [Dyella sp.]|uniref:DNA repair protein RadA n=1 Tax=Dyella sp. TaxID=1869338 RepID=UPI002D7A20F4|nr:DNA repair protein RadA [Dyella sp.]HET6552279.1 DNA repair protein RadA [Dyella sp.]